MPQETQNDGSRRPANGSDPVRFGQLVNFVRVVSSGQLLMNRNLDQECAAPSGSQEDDGCASQKVTDSILGREGVGARCQHLDQHKRYYHVADAFHVVRVVNNKLFCPNK